MYLEFSIQSVLLQHGKLRSCETLQYRKLHNLNSFKPEKIWPITQLCIFTLVAETVQQPAHIHESSCQTNGIHLFINHIIAHSR